MLTIASALVVSTLTVGAIMMLTIATFKAFR